MRPMRRLAALALLPLTVACSDRPTPAAPDPPSFIVGGTPTGDGFASVGALLFDFNADGVIDGDDQWCTGSLIAPTVFLTAAHCIVTPFTPAGTQFHISFSPDLCKSTTVIRPVNLPRCRESLTGRAAYNHIHVRRTKQLREDLRLILVEIAPKHVAHAK